MNACYTSDEWATFRKTSEATAPGLRGTPESKKYESDFVVVRQFVHFRLAVNLLI
jgi:hypothetical protein